MVLRLWRRVFCDGSGRRTLRCFRVLCVVGVGRLHRDLRAFLRGSERKCLRGHARDGLAIGEPLIVDSGGCAVGVADCGGQGFAHFRRAADFDAARLVRLRLRIGLRLRLRIGLRLRLRIGLRLRIR